MRISDADADTGLQDVSDAVFFITAPTSAAITVTSPNRGESLLVGSVHPITWTSTGEIENVKIEYSADIGTTWIEIISLFNNGSYEWLVPDDPSNDCLVRISGTDTDDAPWDVSDVVFSIVSSTTNCGESWISANYPGGVMKCVTYGESKFVSVGNGGTITISSNGIGWKSGSSGTNENIHGVAYGGNIFAAVGDNGNILTSPDGTTWELQSANTSLDLRGIAYGDDKFMAVGAGGVILTSSNGTSWDNRSSVISTDFLNVAYGNSLYVIVGKDGKILTSPDGFEWTSRSSKTRNTLSGIVYNDSRFIVTGVNIILYSLCQ